MLDTMECGNVTTVRALGLDLGSTHVKAVVVGLGDSVQELAVVEVPTAGLGGRDLVAAALGAAQEALESAGGRVAVVGIASMAETGALVDRAGEPGALVRWDGVGNPEERLALAHRLDAREVHAATGAPLVPKLPLLTWAALAAAGLPPGARWAFAADLVAAALTGRISTDHTLAGRSGAYPLPPAGAPLGRSWEPALLDAVGVPRSLLPDIHLPGESAGAVRAGLLHGATGAAVYIAGHDHAVAARTAGADRPGRIAHSLGTTEAVIAVASPHRAVDRTAAGREGMSVTRAVDGAQEAVLAGSPAAGSLIADWRERSGAPAADALLARRPPVPTAAVALPYPRGRQAPDPDPRAAYRLLGAGPADPDPGVELTGILRGLAAHGAWMRAVAAALAGSGEHPELVAVGAPVRGNPRLAGLMASLAAAPLRVLDLRAPVACGAAMLAAERAGLVGRAAVPFLVVEPADDGMPDLADRFARAVRAASTVTQGAP